MRYPKVFSPLYINMVKASELSGGFSRMLNRISDYLGQQIETRSQVKGAMIYPGIIGALAIGTTIFLLVVRGAAVLDDLRGQGGGAAGADEGAARGVRLRGQLLVCAGFRCGGRGVGIFADAAHRTGDGCGGTRLKLSVPLFKKLFRALYISRSLHTMGELVNAGVPMLDTIAITAEISGNALYRRMWRAVYTAVKQGKEDFGAAAAQPAAAAVGGADDRRGRGVGAAWGRCSTR